MEQITDITIGTSIICLGVYFVILFFQYAARKIWAATPNKIIRGVIKWVGTMWLPLWPIAIGATGVRFIPSIPMPNMITELSPAPGITWTIYGAFCGLICMAVVKGIKQALEKKGIDLNMPDLKMAKLAVKNGNGKPKEDKAESDDSDKEPDSEQPKKKKAVKRAKKSEPEPEPEPEPEEPEED